MMCAIFQAKVRLRQRRRQATIALDCLRIWGQEVSKLGLAMKHFHYKMRRLQRFWRTSAERLKTVCLGIARRWKIQEKSLLAKELNVAEPLEQMERKRMTRRETEIPV